MPYSIEGRDILINGFEGGIADGPTKGLSDVRNLDLVSIPGEASVSLQTILVNQGTVTGAVFTANAATDFITWSGTFDQGSLGANISLTVSNSGGALPAPLAVSTTYYMINSTSTTFQVATTPGGTAINLTTNGTGTNTFTTVNMVDPRYFTTETITSGSSITYNYYMVDDGGKVWYYNGSRWIYLNNPNATAGRGNGIMVYKGYLLVFQTAQIDYISTSNVLTNAWVANWQTLTSTFTTISHQAWLGQDDTVYFCNGSTIGSFFQKPGQVFNPATPATYTFNATALQLPTNDVAQCICELGTTLLVGGIKNQIYPWNRAATSFTYPILLAENNVVRMITVNTLTYIFTGNRGRIYVTNGTSAQLYKKMPDHLSGAPNPIYTWGGACFNKNQLYFGISATASTGNAINVYGGLWAVDTDTKALRLTNRLSYGDYSGSVTAITSILGSQVGQGTGLFIGWSNGSGYANYGIDQGTSTPYSTYVAYIDTDLIPIGQILTKKTYENIEFKLATPMVAGEKMKISARSNITEAYTQVGETTAAVLSDVYTVNFENYQWLQLRIEFTSTSSTPSYCRLVEVRVR